LAARKADFLRYIDAEQALERLREIRTLQKKRDHRNTKREQQTNTDGDDDPTSQKKQQEEHIGDVHIVQHLHLLFVRAIRKFRSDLSLHLLHADFCKTQNSWTRLGRVYAEALQIFPRKTGVWIEAASHEFFGPTRSIHNARILLQRGLRINNTCQDLWMEYFSLELHYAQTLKGRRQILQLQEEEESTDDEYHKIVAVVYRNAIQAIPGSIPFRLRFLDTCRRFPNTESLMESIQAPLQTDFASEPEAWMARALYEAEKQSNTKQPKTKMEESAAEENDMENDNDTDEPPAKKSKQKDPVVEVLEEAIESLPNDDMYLQAFRFALRYQSELDQRGQDAKLISKFITRLLKQAAHHSSPDLALEQADYYTSLGQKQKALQVLKDFCSGHKKVPSALWIRWAGMVAPNTSKSILGQALDRIPMNESADYMKVLLQFFGAQLLIMDDKKVDDSKLLFDTFQRILLLAPSATELVVEEIIGEDLPFGVESVAQACVKYLDSVHESSGVKRARKIYTAVLFQSSLSVNPTNVEHIKAFIDKCTTLEETDKTRRRRIYDKAVELFAGTSLEEAYREERNEKAIYQ
jgi:U3 small nucleolar RNA-associated protein 6